MSTAVSGIKDIEAQTLDGISVQKIYFQPDVSIDLAIAQIINATNYIRELMPPGIQAPLVVQYNASSVPVLQISLSSDGVMRPGQVRRPHGLKKDVSNDFERLLEIVNS